MRKLKLPYVDMEQMFRRMIFNVFSRNIDDHTKNFSFTMDRTGLWKLAPAYDFTFTVYLSASGYINKQSLFVNGKNDGITERDLLRVGRDNEIKNPKKIMEEVKNALSRFDDFALQNEIPSDWRDKIRNEIRRYVPYTQQ